MLWCDIRSLLLGLLILIDHVRSDICGNEFTDIQSSAILAPVIFEGKVTGKLDINNNRYNATVKVLKIHKGKKYLMEGSKKIRRVTLGEFGPQDKPQCISEVDINDKKYIFFVRSTLSDKYYEVTALPVKQSKKSTRSVRKIICRNCAKIPKIKRIKDQKKQEGQKIRVKCSAKAKPRAVVFKWYKDDVLITRRKGLNIKNGKKSSRLQINRVKKSDAGRYKCIASNAVGEEEAFFSIEVTPKQVTHPVCPTQTYCFNGGTCHYMPDLNNETFCRCPVEWAGSRCETYDYTQLTRETSRQAKLLHDRTLIIIGIVIAVLVFIIICVVSYFMSRRARKKWEKRRLMKSKKNIPDSSIPLLDDVDSSALANRRKTSPPQIRPSVHKNTQTGSSLAQIFPTIEKQPGNTLTETPTVESKVEIPLNHFMPSNRNRAARGSRSRLKAVSVDDPTVEEEKPSRNPPTRSRSDPNPPWKTESIPRQDSIDEVEADDLEHSESMQDVPLDAEGYAPLDEIDYPAEPQTENIVSPYPETGTPESDPGPTYTGDPGVIDVHNMNEFPDEVPSPITDDPATNPLLPFDSSDSEEEHSPLPVLYISEEDIRTSVDDLQSLEIDSGNVNDTLSEHDLSPNRDNKQVPNGNDSDMASHASNSSATSSSAASVRSPSYIMYNSYQDPNVSTRGWDEQGTPVSDHFAYNSIPDSDTNIIDGQFMHKPSMSPNKRSDNRYSNVNNKKLKDVRDDQDPIPI